MRNIVSKRLKYWWLQLISGLFMIILAILVLETSIAPHYAFVFLFQVGFLVSGSIQIVFVLSNKDSIPNWRWSLLLGGLDVFLAVSLGFNPDLSVLILPIYIGFILLCRSIMGIEFSVELEQALVKGWRLVLANAILGILFSFMMIWNPLLGGLSVVFYSAFNILCIGITQIAVAFSLKKSKQKLVN